MSNTRNIFEFMAKKIEWIEEDKMFAKKYDDDHSVFRAIATPNEEDSIRHKLSVTNALEEYKKVKSNPLTYNPNFLKRV